MTEALSRTLLTVALLLGLAQTLAACGDEELDPRSQCNAESRIFIEGRVGPTAHALGPAEPFPGLIGDTFYTAVLEGGENPHLIGFTTNSALDIPLLDALIERLQSGAQDAGQLTVSTRPEDLPCDPRDGVICAAYGIDTNRDGILFGANEVIYPVESGDIRFTEVNGNVIAADFNIAFDPLSSGQEAGGDRGGRLRGCYHYFRTSDREHLF